MILSMLLFLTGAGQAMAGDLTLSLDQKEYYFTTGEKALIPLHVINNYNRTISGDLTYTLSQEMNTGGMSFTSSRANSTNMSLEQGNKTVGLDMGTSDAPATLKVSMTFHYQDRDPYEVNLSDIIIHFVSDKSQIKNQQNPVRGSSQKSSENQGGGQGDPFNQLNRMQREMDNRFQQQDQFMNEMMKNRMRQLPGQSNPPGSSGKPGQEIPNNQIPQDSQALKNQMEGQLKQQQQMKDDFQKNLARNEEFQKKHQELAGKSFNIDKENYNPTSADTGSFEMNYKNKDGKDATLKGNIKDGKMENIESSTPEDKQKLLNTLRDNADFKKYSNELEKKGFKEEDSQVEQSGNSASAAVQYKSEKGRTASIKAQFEDGKVKSVDS